MWFVATAKWNVEVRGVLYSQGKVLVPLLPDEVPFSYSDVNKDVVFLWDPATGMALATERRKAVVVAAPVAPGDSAVALFGEQPKDDGYCYRLVTGERLDLGEYPTVRELADGGVGDTAGVSYVETGPGVYHCELGGGGLRFDQLAETAVVGGSAVIAGYMLLGITAAAYLSVKGVRPILDGVCVTTAASVNLEVVPEVDKLHGVKRSVRWFAYRQLKPGVILNMGMVSPEVGENALPKVVAVDVPSGARGLLLYWNTMDGGTLRTRAREGEASLVGMDTGGNLAGLYIYTVTSVPLPDTQPHAIKCSGG